MKKLELDFRSNMYAHPQRFGATGGLITFFVILLFILDLIFAMYISCTRIFKRLQYSHGVLPTVPVCNLIEI
jgi:hypothetical protein